MKLLKPLSMLAPVALVIPLALSLGSAAPMPQRAHGAEALRVDDPPPDPAECPFCGGNPALHKQRMQALLQLSALLFERSMP
ncbi:MAG: hypothetical protein HZA53_17375 [Planctomycetes bacterium]|nr:hypothetical protein [Planctomycetota bacterium]